MSDEEKKVVVVVESGGDLYGDVIENVNLMGSLIQVLFYAEDLVRNDPTDIEAQHCLKVLGSMAANVKDAIETAIS